MRGVHNFAILSRTDLSTIQTGFLQSWELIEDLESTASSVMRIDREISEDVASGDVVAINQDTLFLVSEITSKNEIQLKPFYEILNQTVYLFHDNQNFGDLLSIAFGTATAEPLPWLSTTETYSLYKPDGGLVSGQVWSVNPLDQLLEKLRRNTKKMVFAIDAEAKTVTLSLADRGDPVNIFEEDFSVLSLDESKVELTNHITVVGAYNYEESGTKYQKWAVAVGYIDSDGVIHSMYPVIGYPAVLNPRRPVVSAYEEVSINYEEFRDGVIASVADTLIAAYLGDYAEDKLLEKYSHEIILSSSKDRGYFLNKRVTLHMKTGRIVESVVTRIERRSSGEILYTLGSKRANGVTQNLKTAISRKSIYKLTSKITATTY